MIRMPIHTYADILDDSDIIIIPDETIEKLKQMFPGIDVERRLYLLKELFTYKKETRANDREELAHKVREILELKVFSEEMVKGMVGDGFIDLDTYMEFHKLWEQL